MGCLGRSGGSMGCICIGRVGRWAVFMSGGSIGCVWVGRLGRWVVSG